MASEDEKQDKGLSEYERFMAELTPVLEKFKVTDLTENDVEFLADKTETDWINIKLLILAHYYAALTGLPRKFFYGLLRTQSPSDPLALLTETSEKLRFGLLESIQDKIVSAFDFSTISLDQFIVEAKYKWDEVVSEKQEVVTNQLKAMQRVYNVAPRFDSMRTLLAAGLHSAQDISHLPPDMFESMPDNKTIVREYIKRVWSQHDYAAIDENIRADYIQHSPNVPPGREGVKAFFKMVNSAFSDVTFTVEDMLAEGDKVIWRWSLRGKHTGVFQSMLPTDKDFVLTGISILRLAGGKFAELWVEQDMAGLMAQLKG